MLTFQEQVFFSKILHIKPLPEQMLRDYQWAIVAFTWGQFRRKFSVYIYPRYNLENYWHQITDTFPRTDKLMCYASYLFQVSDNETKSRAKTKLVNLQHNENTWIHSFGKYHIVLEMFCFLISADVLILKALTSSKIYAIQLLLKFYRYSSKNSIKCFLTHQCLWIHILGTHSNMKIQRKLWKIPSIKMPSKQLYILLCIYIHSMWFIIVFFNKWWNDMVKAL